MSFFDLELDLELLQALAEQDLIKPTAIQQQVIPKILQGKDLLASAPTGTGKTLAFVLPALQRILDRDEFSDSDPKILILSPTRELARQIELVIKDMTVATKIRSALIVGGVPYGMQHQLLSAPLDVVVATPGRLLEVVEKQWIELTSINMLVLDEADRMLDLGFIESIRVISSLIPVTRQMLMFSATLESDKLKGLASDMLNDDAITEAVANPREVATNIEQLAFQVDNETHREALLKVLICRPDVKQALVFVSQRHEVSHWVNVIRSLHILCDGLHGEIQQSERSKSYKDMARGRLQVLVATDVAARGLDLPNISHVFNIKLPKKADTYVHRAGRAGRGDSDKAWCYSLVDTLDWPVLERIQRYLGQRINRQKIAGLEPKRPEPKTVKKPKKKKSPKTKAKKTKRNKKKSK